MIKLYSKYKKNIILLIVLLQFCCFIPFAYKGIILNDELIMRLQRKKSFISLLFYDIGNEIRMGRYTRILAGINSALSFCTNNMLINNIIQICLLIISIAVFGWFVCELFKSKKIAVMTMFIISIFVPVTFEHAPPNAFVGLVTLPIIYLSVSMICWIRYIEKQEKKCLITSMFFWVLGMMSYEYIVTYAPLFVLIYWGKKYKEPDLIKNTIKKNIYPVLFGVLFILTTFASQKLKGDVYNGVSIGFVSIRSSLDIIKTLVLSACPGYFFLNKKYQYLMFEYTGGKYLGLYNFLNNNFDGQYKDLLKELSSFLREYCLNIRLILIEIIVCVICFWFCKKASKDQKGIGISIYSAICIIIYIVLPIIPNSIASIYQGQVTDSFFTSLPVSLNIFFTISLFCAFVFDLLSYIKIGKIIIILATIIIIFNSFFVQIMNGIISEKHKNNYERLLVLESLTKTKCMYNLSGGRIYAPDFYETRDLLASPIAYWNDYMKINNNECLFVEDDADYNIFYVNEEYFCVVGSEEIAVFSPNRISDVIALQLDEENYYDVLPDMYIIDGDFYCYRYTIDDKKPIEDGKYAFEDEMANIGYTLEESLIVDGIYEDGWVAPHAEVKLFTSNGKVFLKGRYVSDVETEKPILKITINDNEMDYVIKENCFVVEMDTAPNEVADIIIECNRTMNNTGEDVRKLSFVLDDLYSE